MTSATPSTGAEPPSYGYRPSTGGSREAPWLFVTVDDRHGVALLRGDGANQCARLFSGSYPGADSRPSRWSSAGRGWVIPSKLVPDVVAYCEHRRELVVVSERKATAS